MPNFRQELVDTEDLALAKKQYDRSILSKRNPGERRDIPPTTSPAEGKRIEGILDVIGAIEDGCGMTVTLTRNPPIIALPGLGPFVHPVAVLQFGQGGERIQAEIDVVSGQQVFIPASSIRVFAFNEYPYNYQGEPPPQVPVGVGAFVNEYPPARRSRIFRSYGIFALPVSPAPGSNAVFLIPPFASTVVVERLPFTSTMNEAVLDPLGTVIYEIVVPASTRMTPLDLAGEGVAVRVTNLGPDVMSGKVIFEIGL